jgi:translation initiation factor 2 subunit 2
MEAYDLLLNRAISKTPNKESSGERFVVPRPKTFIEGRTTVWDNFDEIREKLNRDSDHFVKHLLREMGTAGKVEGNRLVLQGRFTSDAIAALVDDYVSEYVRCAECGRPDTKLVKYDRVTTLKCDACGAQRSIQKRRQMTAKMTQAASIEEGKIYDNALTVMNALNEAKPGTVKGKFVTSVSIASSMNPGLRLEA